MAENLLGVIQIVGNILEAASDYNLGVEVIASALIALKENPSISIDEALDIGYNEWVK